MKNTREGKKEFLFLSELMETKVNIFPLIRVLMNRNRSRGCGKVDNPYFIH